jgi:hypothetical protein
MNRHSGLRILLAALILALPTASHAQLPTEISGIRFNSGQDIVPYFEGWIKNPDGTFDLVFGYFNRNWQEELAIPTGPNNSVEPGGPAGGQPTYFLPRRQRWVFRLRVPADFGKKEVVWTITANGRSEKAYGNLLAAQEINDRVIQTNGNLDPGEGDPNMPPSIETAATLSAQVGTPVTLTTFVRDDGLPKPRAAPAPRAPAATGSFGGQVDRPAATGPGGLTVRWLQYGGPGKVTFEKEGPLPVIDGRAVTTATFSTAGTYRVRATASDGALSTTTDVVVTVR